MCGASGGHCIGTPAVGNELQVSYYLLHTTYPILFISVLARQLCIPVPAILFLLSAGALAGIGRLSFIGILLVAVLGCLLGDLVWFEAGRLRGKRVLRLLCALTLDPGQCISLARTAFAKWGHPLLLVAKFIPGLDGITPPLAGMSGTSRAHFLTYDTTGSALWAGAYLGAGFLFASRIDNVVRYISAFAMTLILVLGVPLLFFFAWKLIQLVRMIWQLRSFSITPEELKMRLDAGEKIGIVDLLRFEDDPQGLGAIPGAVRVDPREMRQKTRFVMPEGIDIVLYCGSRNSFVSARVATVMRRNGVRRIRVLDGGLAAWNSHGFPLTTELADPYREMKRLGIDTFPSRWPPSPSGSNLPKA
jgi:membrane protein DedA with SNARE-associated domain/rhodanese-related sulfurtransferase